MFNFYKILFFNTLIFGTLLTVSSFSWLSMWIGLEINLMSFIPLMTSSKNMYPSEAALKYFITQVLASNILLFSIIMFMLLDSQINLMINFYLMIILNSALFMKLGAAPFHFWFPEIISGMNWNNSLILLTWQKIAPMILIMYNLNNTLMISIIIITSSIISGMQNFNQTDLRKILAYSSINHIGWMLASMMNSFTIWFNYFAFYTIVSLNIIIIFKKFNIFNLAQLFNMMNQFKLIKFLFIMNFFSMSGLPPFLGFMPKWLTINNLVENKLLMLSVLMTILTLINIYIYLRMTFSTLTLSKKENILYFNKNISFMWMTWNFLTLSSLMSVNLINLF